MPVENGTGSLFPSARTTFVIARTLVIKVLDSSRVFCGPGSMLQVVQVGPACRAIVQYEYAQFKSHCFAMLFGVMTLQPSPSISAHYTAVERCSQARIDGMGSETWV